MSSGGHSWHKKDWMTAALIAAAAAATAGSAGAFAPAAAAGAGAGGAALGGTEAASAGLLGTFGGMGAEQAAALAAQNAGLGFGADIATLNAAAGANGSIAAVPWKGMTALGDSLSKFAGNPSSMKMASGLLGGQPQPAPQAGSGGPPPQSPDNGPSGSQIVGGLLNGPLPQLPPGITPDMLKDPQVIAMLKAKGIIV